MLRWGCWCFRSSRLTIHRNASWRGLSCYRLRHWRCDCVRERGRSGILISGFRRELGFWDWLDRIWGWGRVWWGDSFYLLSCRSGLFVILSLLTFILLQEVSSLFYLLFSSTAPWIFQFSFPARCMIICRPLGWNSGSRLVVLGPSHSRNRRACRLRGRRYSLFCLFIFSRDCWRGEDCQLVLLCLRFVRCLACTNWRLGWSDMLRGNDGVTVRDLWSVQWQRVYLLLNYWTCEWRGGVAQLFCRLLLALWWEDDRCCVRPIVVEIESRWVVQFSFSSILCWYADSRWIWTAWSFIPTSVDNQPPVIIMEE